MKKSDRLEMWGTFFKVNSLDGSFFWINSLDVQSVGPANVSGSFIYLRGRGSASRVLQDWKEILTAIEIIGLDQIDIQSGRKENEKKGFD